MMRRCHPLKTMLQPQPLKPIVAQVPGRGFDGLLSSRSLSHRIKAGDIKRHLVMLGQLLYKSLIPVAVLAPQLKIAVGYGEGLFGTVT